MYKILALSCLLGILPLAFAQEMDADSGGFTGLGYSVQEDGGFTGLGDSVKEPRPEDLNKPMPAVNDKPIYKPKSKDPLPSKPNLVECSYDGDGKSVWCEGVQYVKKKTSNISDIERSLIKDAESSSSIKKKLNSKSSQQ